MHLYWFVSFYVKNLPQRESSVTVLEGVDVTQTNMSFFRQQLTRIATHILRCTGKLEFMYPYAKLLFSTTASVKV